MAVLFPPSQINYCLIQKKEEGQIHSLVKEAKERELKVIGLIKGV